MIPCAPVPRHLASPLEIEFLEISTFRHFFDSEICRFNIFNSPQISHWRGGDPEPCRAIRSLHRHQNPSNAFKSEERHKDHLFLMQILLTQRTQFTTPCTQIIQIIQNHTKSKFLEHFKALHSSSVLHISFSLFAPVDLWCRQRIR